MSDFIECQKYYVPCEFEIPRDCLRHRFVLAGNHFRQRIVPVPKPYEHPDAICSLEVTCWEHKTEKVISQREAQMHVQWIRDSINLLKELCAK